MHLWEFDCRLGRGTVRHAELDDISGLIELNKQCFPSMAEQNVVWNKGQLRNHQRLFREGQLVVEVAGRLVGAAASLIVKLDVDPYRPHTYAGITDGGYFHNHDPAGDTLYGADVYVHPDFRGQGIGHQLYEARRKITEKLNLRRIIAGGRIPGYADVVQEMTPEQYVRSVETEERHDMVLSFQLHEGFVARGILRNYIRDPKSRNHASFLEWLNPEYVPTETGGQRKVRVAAIQYQVRRVQNFDDFAAQVQYFVESAAEYRADFVLFPEFFSMQLLSQDELKKLPPREGIAAMADLEAPFVELLQNLAQRFGVTIIGGTHPVRREGTLYNACPIVFPDGDVVWQPKIHITPSEKQFWGIEGGSELRVVATPKAKIGVLVCYDSEFPEAARYLADEGIEILFVPFCTDDRQGYSRVRYCCQARAIENQIYVVTAGIVGNLPSVPAMDIHYGQAAILTPSDFEFARDGIQAQADSNVETMLVSDLDINDLYRSRAAGSVRPRLDRRVDLFQFHATLKNELGVLNPEEEAPIPPDGDEEEE
jgi:predicted amidohydrolase/GNAT superfamily N-acetyltransferase